MFLSIMRSRFLWFYSTISINTTSNFYHTEEVIRWNSLTVRTGHLVLEVPYNTFEELSFNTLIFIKRMSQLLIF